MPTHYHTRLQPKATDPAYTQYTSHASQHGWPRKCAHHKSNQQLRNILYCSVRCNRKASKSCKRRINIAQANRVKRCALPVKVGGALDPNTNSMHWIIAHVCCTKAGITSPWTYVHQKKLRICAASYSLVAKHICSQVLPRSRPPTAMPALGR